MCQGEDIPKQKKKVCKKQQLLLTETTCVEKPYTYIISIVHRFVAGCANYLSQI